MTRVIRNEKGQFERVSTRPMRAVKDQGMIVAFGLFLVVITAIQVM